MLVNTITVAAPIALSCRCHNVENGGRRLGISLKSLWRLRSARSFFAASAKIYLPSKHLSHRHNSVSEQETFLYDPKLLPIDV
jgi:hypothetical protein